jgi:hypothetical protein
MLVFLIGATNQKRRPSAAVWSAYARGCVDLFSSKLNSVRSPKKGPQFGKTVAPRPMGPRLRCPGSRTPARRLSWKGLQWLLIPPPGAEMAVSCGSRFPGPGLLGLSPRISSSSSDNILATLPPHPLVFLSRCSSLPCLFICVLCVLFFQSFNICELDSRSLQDLTASCFVSHPRFSVHRLSTKTISQNTRAFRVLLFYSFLG